MQTLIIYAGKTGSTEKCARILEEKLENVTIIDLSKEEADISKYDLIIIGASIRIGMIHSKVKKFIKKNQDILKTKKTAYYICCGFPEDYKKYFESNISKELLDNAITYDTFGGEMEMSKQKGFGKLIVKMVSKSEKGKREIKILENNIETFVDKLK